MQALGQAACQMPSASAAELGNALKFVHTKGLALSLHSKDTAEQQQDSLFLSCKPALSVTEAWHSSDSHHDAVARQASSQTRAGRSYADPLVDQPNILPPVRPLLPCCQSRLHITPRDPKQSLKFWKTVPNGGPPHPGH